MKRILVIIMLCLAPMLFVQAAKKPAKSPTYYQSVHRATAECEDGSLYYGKHVKSACAAHEGVMQWFR